MIIMGFWSSLKHFVKAVVRVVVRIVTAVIGLVLGIFDLLLGFLTWPPKKVRLQIFILSNSAGALMNPADLTLSVDFARKTLKDRFNVKLLPYSKNMIEIIKEPAPAAALDVSCDWGALEDEFGEAGEYFGSHLAGWNAIPISLTFPITVFIVHDFKDSKEGCSLGPLSDYLTLSIDGVKSENTLVHEIGHVCNLWHSGSKSNLMWPDDNRGNDVKWFQKNLLRSSRHVLYW
jgi:hypothetical protein